MKHTLLTLLIALLVLTAIPALADDAVTFTDDLTGVYLYPEDSSETDALYIYRYRYPQLAGESDLAAMFNTTYAYTAEDALAFEAPMIATEMQPGDPQKVVDISYEVTCLSEEYLSLRILKRVSVGGIDTVVISGHVIALTGAKAGQITNLPVLIGLLDADETDEWLQTRQTNKADKYAREMVWDRLQEGNGGAFTLYDDLTYEDFEAGFYPEEDVYLSPEGDLVFFMQAGTLAPEEQGEILIRITVEELLDEM